MNLSNKTTDMKLYSRFKHYDGMPYTSDDQHNDSDISARKLGKLLDTLAGTGTLETPVFSTTTSNSSVNIRLMSPIAINIEGDIFLAGNSADVSPLTIPSEDFDNMSIVLISWYTHARATDTLYEYGGTCNNTIQNDIIDADLNVQVSTRYVRNWSLAYVEGTLDYTLAPRDIALKNAIITNAGEKTLTFRQSDMEVVGRCYRVPATANIPSEDGYVYIVPLGASNSGSIKSIMAPRSLYSIVNPDVAPSPEQGNVWYNPTKDTVKMFLHGDWRDVGGSQIIKSTTEPSETKEGTIWYNPDINEFRTYIEGLGYVESTAKVGFIQLQATHTFTQDVDSPQDININIPIETYLPTDILRVIYEGVELVQGVNYTLYPDNRLVVLNDFTVNNGDTLVFSIMRLVSSTDASTTARMLEDHMYVVGNSSANGHVRITDERSATLTSSKGVAASPASVKAVEDMVNVLTDDTTGKKYKLGISNGLLYYKEV